MTAQAPLDRLEPRDFYLRVDRIRDTWHGDVRLHTEPDSSDARYADERRSAALDLEERKMAVRLRDLRKLCEHLPERFWLQADPQLREIEAARLSSTRDPFGALTRLRALVSEWDRSRPPKLPCPECGVEIRGRRDLKLHRIVVHDVTEDE